jgi:hypothetical protein
LRLTTSFDVIVRLVCSKKFLEGDYNLALIGDG